MLRVGLIGLGKMGISHLAIINSHPGVKLAAVCDSTPLVAKVLGRYTGIKVYSDYRALLEKEALDAVVIATPSRFHGEMVGAALDRNLHVFCEKPFCLDVAEGAKLAMTAVNKGLVNQVGYHYRFVGAFQEARRIVQSGALGKLHHLRAEAYGAVVLRPRGSTWRASKDEGGGCLNDYACHAIDILDFLVGTPEAVGGAVLNKIFSRDVEDEVYATLYYADGLTGQLAANWSDESYRKMSLRVTLWGSNGRVGVDRQEVQTFLRDASALPESAGVGGALTKGWSTRYTTDLTEEVWYYLRGEEYSAQIDHFVECIESGAKETRSSFASALRTDMVAAQLRQESASDRNARPPVPARESHRRSGLGRLVGNLRVTAD
jgi:scyllo-inositol 2-dehydrogenase (NADP+)